MTLTEGNPILDTLWLLASKMWPFFLAVLLFRLISGIIKKRAKLDGR